MKLRLLVSVILLILLCACGNTVTSPEMKHGKDTGIPELNTVIKNYFDNFNDINKFSQYTTDEFINRVYSWCSGDTSESKSLEEMKSIYSEINKQSLKLRTYSIEDVEKITSTNVTISVTREWEEGQEDQTSYSIIKIDEEWKIDNRF